MLYVEERTGRDAAHRCNGVGCGSAILRETHELEGLADSSPKGDTGAEFVNFSRCLVHVDTNVVALHELSS